MSIMAGIGDLTGGIANVASSIINNQANESLWKEQMAYNTPEQQVTRLRNAGLNPELAYGKGVSTNVAGSPPTMQAPQIAPGAAGSSILDSIQVDNALKQGGLIDAQADAARASAKNNNTNANATQHNIDVAVGGAIPHPVGQQSFWTMLGDTAGKIGNWVNSTFGSPDKGGGDNVH